MLKVDSSSDYFADAKVYSADANSYEAIVDVPATEQAPPSSTPDQKSSEQITQKLIKTGNIDFQSESIEADYQKISQLLPNFQAYIQTESQSSSSYRLNYELTIRVPSSVYDTLYATISTLPYHLENRSSNVQDVTERYYDLKSRIKNKKALEQRYLDLLKKASVMKDILEIEQSLNEVRTDIERLQGQFNYLSKQVQLSTINLSFYELLPYEGGSTGKRTFFDRVSQALGNGWDAFQSFLIGLFSIWPFLLLLTGMIWLARRLRRNWKKKKDQ